MNILAKVRQDAWSHEDDLLLAETVLRHIREGSTQLNAFEEVGDQLNRTSAACGFRWNAEVRQSYEQAIAIAKRQRKQKKRAMATNQEKQASRALPTLQASVDMAQDTEFAAEEVFSTINQETKYESQPVTTKEDEALDLDGIIHYLKGLKKNINLNQKKQQSLTHLEQEHARLLEENEQLQKNVKQLEEKLENVQEDYQTFLQIMDRARKMVVFNDGDENSAPAFVMDKNGNLEQVAR